MPSLSRAGKIKAISALIAEAEGIDENAMGESLGRLAEILNEIAGLTEELRAEVNEELDQSKGQCL